MRRQETFLDQTIVRIDVGDDGFEKIGALHEALGEHLPFGFRDHHRNMGEWPRALA